MQKRLVVLALLSGAVVFVACGKNGAADQTGTTETSVNAPPTTDVAATSTPAPTTALPNAHSYRVVLPAQHWEIALAETVDAGTPPSTDPGTTPTPTVDAGSPTPTQTVDAGTPAPTTGNHLYEAPASFTTRSVPSSNQGGTPVISAYSYTTASGAKTIPYPVVDLYSSQNLVPGTYTDSVGVSRMGYQFTLAPGQGPDWGSPPRAEFDSATAGAQNSPSGAPDPAGWNAGIITEGMDMWFSWSMYLSPTFNLSQPWATLFQLHAGNSNWADVSQNLWPNPGWPGIGVENDTIAFGMGPDATSPNQVWKGSISALRGKWQDIAIHVKFSTGSSGLMEMYLNGQLVGTQVGPNMVYVTNNGTPDWYYLKQGYYRDASISTTDTVYMTPIVVNTL